MYARVYSICSKVVRGCCDGFDMGERESAHFHKDTPVNPIIGVP